MPQHETATLTKQAILRERARLLARTEAGEQSTEVVDVVEFMLAHEHYAVGIEAVVEVYPLKEMTPLPCTPAFVRGVVNVRGQIVAVIDIKTFFNLPGNALADSNKVIILGSDATKLAVLADEVLGVRELPAGALQPALPTMGGIGAEYLLGVTVERLMVLDAGRILADERIVVDEEVAY